MSTKINLEYPFIKDYKSGYLNINKEPRRVVLLVRRDNSKTSISYARYLMSCSLGRYLKKNEYVDHIDNNQLNDVLENFQILTPLENCRKSNYKGLFLDFICPICNKEFKLSKQRAYGKTSPACSRECGYQKLRKSSIR